MADPEDARYEDIRVLILEDNPADAELMAYELSSGGFVFKSVCVQSETSFNAALHQFSPDIILSDYDLPGFSGAKALEIKKEVCPEIPFILVTGAVGEERAIEILTGGATDYVLKKNLSRLLPAVQRALHESYEHRTRKEAEAERDALLKQLESRIRERTEALQAEVNERKRVEEELRKSAENYRHLVKHAPAGIFEIEYEGPRLKHVNDAMCTILGYSQDELLAMNPVRLLDEESRRLFDDRIRKILANEEIDPSVAYRGFTKDGREIWAAFNLKLIYENGKPTGALVVAHDVTERRQAEVREKRQAQFVFIISQLLAKFASCSAAEVDQEIAAGLKEIGLFLGMETIYIILTSRETRTWSSVYDWNAPGVPSVLQKYQDVPFGIYSWSERAILKVQSIQINSLDDLPPEAVQEKKEWECEGLKSQLFVPLRGRGESVIGSCGFRSYSRPIRWSHEDIQTLRLFSDAIAGALERKRAEVALQERTSQLEMTNEELESFSYSVSHDLRAPLRAIDGFLENLVKGLEAKLDEEEHRKFDLIQDNTKKMNHLIADLLALSRIGRTEMTRNTVDMSKLARAVWQEQVNANPDRSIEISFGDLPKSFGDRSLLWQVFSNLLSNAVKYTRKRQYAAIEIGGELKDGESVYHVKDNGVGFDMDYYDKLFGVFQRLHPASDYEGTGIGLTIVQRIVRRHGGRVWAEAKVGKGATFFFSLPRLS